MERISIFKQSKSPNYYIQYYVKGRKNPIQESTGKKTKQEALGYLAARKETLAQEQVVKDAMSLSLFKKHFIADAENHCAAGTVKLHTLALDSLIFAIKDISTKDVTPFLISQWQLAMKKKRKERGGEYLSVTYINILYRCLKHAFKQAQVWKMVAVSPFIGCSPLPTGNIKPVFLTVDQANDVLAECPAMIRDFVAFSINAGMRPGEVRALRWTDVYMKKTYVIVRNNLTHMTKTREERSVPMNAGSMEALEHRVEVKNGEYVFHWKGKPLKSNTVANSFKRVVKRVALDSKLHPHSLRHSCASILVQNGASLTAVKEMLGHSSITVTQMYTHDTAESLQSEAAKMPLIAIGVKRKRKKKVA